MPRRKWRAVTDSRPTDRIEHLSTLAIGIRLGFLVRLQRPDPVMVAPSPSTDEAGVFHWPDAMACYRPGTTISTAQFAPGPPCPGRRIKPATRNTGAGL